MKIKWEFIVIIALLAIFVLRECTRHTPTDSGKTYYEDTIKVLRQEKAVIQARQNDQVKVSNAKGKSDSAQISRMDSKIQALQKKAVGQRVVIESVIIDNPALKSYIDTQQEIIFELQVEVDTLKSQIAFREMLYADLVALDYQEDKFEAQMQIESSKRIADLEKQLKKKSPKRFGNILKEIGKDAVIFLAGFGFGRGSG